MDLIKNKSLKPFNTFGVDVKAAYFVEVFSRVDLQEILREWDKKIFILGGGSNLLLTEDVEDLVIKNSIRGKEVIREAGNFVIVRAGGGEDWHQFVLWCLDKDLGGVENLSFIPGTVGAAPIQNIGAYGAELKDVFVRLEAVRVSSGELVVFEKEDCGFGYRDSIFKRELKGDFFITSVYFRLSKEHRLNTSYEAVEAMLQKMRVRSPTIRDVSRAVIEIRKQKLPDPAVLGNAGSFFKNPEISREKLEKLQKQYPRIVFYPLDNGKVKIPAAWLIEQCGWKGKRFGNVGCYERQALVLVNYGQAAGLEIKELAGRIYDSVLEKFDIMLETEVNIL